MSPRAAWRAVPAALLLGCAASPPLHPSWHPSPALADAPLRERDAVPFAPRAGAQASGRHAVRAAAPDDAARDVALAYAEALLRADEQALSGLLDAQVTLIAEGSRKPRRDVITTCLAEPASAAYAQARRVEALFDPRAIHVTDASAEGQNVPLPAGALVSDRLVRFPPPLPAGVGARRLPCLGNLYVRLGDPTRIVALMR